MRRALALAVAALALAACTVEVEGAPCGTPGLTTDCPSGQACGNDGTCSEHALSCTAPESRCTPGQTRCAGADAKERAESCTADDRACGTWVATPCTSQGLACGTTTPGSVAACECPTFEGPEFAADPVVGSPSGAAPFPTGAASPAGCRFKSLGDAISRAGQLSVSAAVQVHGAPGSTVVFDAESGDGRVIVIPSTVTVKGAPPPAAATVLRGAATADEALVGLLGRLERFRIVRAEGDGAAVSTSCDGGGKPTLSGVAVDGGNELTTGVDVRGACGADLVGVDVSGVRGPALVVRADAGAEVKVSGGMLRDSEIGARVVGGNVTFGSETDPLAAVEVAGNAREGVLVTTGAATDARLYGAKVHGNGGTGIVVELASAGSSLTLRDCAVHSNGGATPRHFGPGDPGRSAGGILLVQGALPFTFLGNQVYGNAGDQLAFESSSAWSVAPAACGASSNRFGCVADGGYAVAIAGGGSVDARNAVWPAVPVQTFASAGVTASPYCNGLTGIPAPPACP